MKKLIVAGMVFLGAISSLATAAQGNAEAGKSKSAACAGCHGPDGNSPAPAFPKIAGQSERYLYKQLQDIKSNVRPVPVMTPIVANLTDQDLADLAAYYAAQKPSTNQAKKDIIAKGEQIYRAGLRDRGVPACQACHSPTGSGNGPAGFPRLGGQHADYIVAQLKAYRAAADGDAAGRANDGETKTMRSIAAYMTDSEIAAVANYVSGLH